MTWTRSDLYSLGAVAYYLLTGVPVFEGDNVIDVCSHHLHTEPAPPSTRTELRIPTSLDRVILRCLAKDPGARPASARELAAALERLSDVEEWTRAAAEEWWTPHEPGRYERAVTAGRAR